MLPPTRTASVLADPNSTLPCTLSVPASDALPGCSVPRLVRVPVPLEPTRSVPAPPIRPVAALVNPACVASVAPAATCTVPDCVSVPSSVSEPASTRQVPSLARVPVKLLLRSITWDVLPVLRSRPALVKAGTPLPTFSMGLAALLLRLKVAPARLVKRVGRQQVVMAENSNRSSPLRLAVPALIQCEPSPSTSAPPAAARSMVVVPSVVSVRVLASALLALPPTVVAPVTRTEPLPPSVVPLSARLASTVSTGELRFSLAAPRLRLAGSDKAPVVELRLSVDPAPRLRAGTDRSPPAERLAVPAVTVRLGTLKAPPALSATVPLLDRLGRPRLPLALTVSVDAAATVVGSSAVLAPLPVIVTLVVALGTPTIAIEAPPDGAEPSVRTPPNSMAVPAAMA